LTRRRWPRYRVYPDTACVTFGLPCDAIFLRYRAGTVFALGKALTDAAVEVVRLLVTRNAA
jgi:hypothetical protein